MTVCIATYCQGPNGPIIVGACDRMLTGEFTEFEPRFSKIHNLTPNIVALIAGDTAAQSSVCVKAFEAKPKSVREAAEVFSTELSRHNRQQAERKILAPLGFSMRSFFDRQAHLSPEFVDDVVRQIRGERANIETIICGIDDIGAHIYTVDDFGRLSYGNSVGFAAVGDGAWHARSQLMFAKYDPMWPLTRALLVTYISKRRAEVTPGVGVDTDAFFIAPPSGFCFFQPNIMDALAAAYGDITAAQSAAIDAGNDRIERFCQELVNAAQESQSQTSQSISQPSTEDEADKPPKKTRRRRN